MMTIGFMSTDWLYSIVFIILCSVIVFKAWKSWKAHDLVSMLLPGALIGLVLSITAFYYQSVLEFNVLHAGIWNLVVATLITIAIASLSHWRKTISAGCIGLMTLVLCNSSMLTAGMEHMSYRIDMSDSYMGTENLVKIQEMVKNEDNLPQVKGLNYSFTGANGQTITKPIVGMHIHQFANIKPQDLTFSSFYRLSRALNNHKHCPDWVLSGDKYQVDVFYSVTKDDKKILFSEPVMMKTVDIINMKNSLNEASKNYDIKLYDIPPEAEGLPPLF